jgi:hypothetical protein
MWTAVGLDMTVNRVCEVCNSGWMNDLDHNAGRFFAGMIQGRGRELHQDSQPLVAAWAAKTALALYLVMSTESGHGAPLNHYREIEITKLPPRWTAVWLAAYDREVPVLGFQTGGLVRLSGAGRPETHGYLMTILIGHLVAQVFGYLRHQEMAFKSPAWDKAIVQIWPNRQTVIWPPPLILGEPRVMPFATRFLCAT